MSRARSGGLSRRQFVSRTASLAAATTILPRHVLGGPGVVAPSDKVNVAIIGVGGQGRTNFRNLAQESDCQVIAIADPCEEWDLSPYYYGGKGGRGPVQAEIEKTYSEKTPNYRCAVYEDFRVMLEREKAIDAPLVGWTLIQARNPESAMKGLQNIAAVSRVYEMPGQFNLIASVQAKDPPALMDTLTKEVHKLEGVRRTETLMGFREPEER